MMFLFKQWILKFRCSRYIINNKHLYLKQYFILTFRIGKVILPIAETWTTKIMAFGVRYNGLFQLYSMFYKLCTTKKVIRQTDYAVFGITNCSEGVEVKPARQIAEEMRWFKNKKSSLGEKNGKKPT